MWNPSTCACECNDACKIDEYIHTKIVMRKCLFGKLILAYANKILNTVETTLVDKKETCEKSYSLIYTILSVIILLFLLAVIFISCYNYCTKDWVRKENSLSY